MPSPDRADDERFEQIIAFVGSQLPQPVEHHDAADGTLIFTGGTPSEVVVHLDDSTVSVYEYAGLWESPERFVVRPRRVGLLKWRRLPETPLMSALGALIKGAREQRRSRFRPCRVCGREYPPEMLAARICPHCGTQPATIH